MYCSRLSSGEGRTRDQCGQTALPSATALRRYSNAAGRHLLLLTLIAAGCCCRNASQSAMPSQALADRVRLLEEHEQRFQRQLEALKVSSGVEGPLVSTAGLPTRGDAGAPIVLIEFADFQCPYCRRYFQDTLPMLDRTFVATGKLRYVFHSFPLQRLHRFAFGAAAAAECAARQGRFWEMHHRLFQQPGQVTPESLEAQAQAVGISVKSFLECKASIGPAIDALVAEARQLDVGSTPTFLIGYRRDNQKVAVQRRVRGAQPYDVFKTAIDDLLEDHR